MHLITKCAEGRGGEERGNVCMASEICVGAARSSTSCKAPASIGNMILDFFLSSKHFFQVLTHINTGRRYWKCAWQFFLFLLTKLCNINNSTWTERIFLPQAVNHTWRIFPAIDIFLQMESPPSWKPITLIHKF